MGRRKQDPEFNSKLFDEGVSNETVPSTSADCGRVLGD